MTPEQPVFVVIFRARIRQLDDDYARMAERMRDLALADQAMAETPRPKPGGAAVARRIGELRTALIDLHIAVEDALDGPLDTQIRALYVKMADARRLDLPPMPAS